jgi:IstB-like ATP binding protein
MFRLSQAATRAAPTAVVSWAGALPVGRQAILAGYTVLFMSAPTLVAQLAKAHSDGRFEDRLTHFGKRSC